MATELLSNLPEIGKVTQISTLKNELKKGETSAELETGLASRFESAGFQFRLTIGKEIVLVTAVTGSGKKLTLTRNVGENSVEEDHPVGSKVFNFVPREAIENFASGEAFQGTWASGTTYAKNATVKFNGNAWSSTQNNNKGNEPILPGPEGLLDSLKRTESPFSHEGKWLKLQGANKIGKTTEANGYCAESAFGEGFDAAYYDPASYLEPKVTATASKLGTSNERERRLYACLEKPNEASINGYCVIFFRTAAEKYTVKIQKITAGTYSTLKEETNVTLKAAQTYALLVRSGKVKVEVNGSVVVEVADTSYTQGKVGLGAKGLEEEFATNFEVTAITATPWELIVEGVNVGSWVEVESLSSKLEQDPARMTFRVRKEDGGNVCRIRGTLKTKAGQKLGNSVVIFTLPVGYRPTALITMPTHFLNGSGVVQTAFINIGTDGKCEWGGANEEVPEKSQVLFDGSATFNLT